MINYMECLNEDQRRVVEECLTRPKAGMAMDRGFGKTRTSIATAKHIMGDAPILFVCKLTLISNFLSEIELAFGGKIRCFVYHKDAKCIKKMGWKMKDIYHMDQLNCDVVVTTPETVAFYYEEDNIQSFLIEKRIVKHRSLDVTTIYYHYSEEPFENCSFLFSTAWGTVIVDEFHEIGNISAKRTQGIVSLPGRLRYALSGTLNAECKPEILLGYHLFIQDNSFPKSLPETKSFTRSPNYKGLDVTFIKGKAKPLNIMTTKISHIIPLSNEEERIYKVIRKFLIEINAEVKKCTMDGDIAGQRKFSGQRLAMLTALRQCCVSPLIPIANMALDIFDYSSFDRLSQKFDKHIKDLGIDYYLNNPENIISSRVRRAIDIVNDTETPIKKTVIYTPWRTVVDLLVHCMKLYTNKYVATLEGKMSIEDRKEEIERCKKREEFILILTYDIGSSGLNMQFADSVILVDYKWNKLYTDQAVSRVVRPGQKQDVYVHYLYSNTGAENAVLKKQLEKMNLGNELLYGPAKSTVKTIKIEEIINIIEQEKVTEKFDTLYIKPQITKEIISTRTTNDDNENNEPDDIDY